MGPLMYVRDGNPIVKGAICLQRVQIDFFD